MSKLRIGFVGVGGMGQCAHLRNYAALKDLCDVVAIAELKKELGQKVAARYSIPKVYASHQELLANEKLDGIVSSQPFTRHGTLMPELVKSGIPIFTEKPLAGSVEAGQKIVKALDETPGNFLMVGYHKRSDPATRYAKTEIDRLKSTGELGKLKYIRVLMPAGDWIANGFNELIRTNDPNPALVWDPPASDMDEETNKAYFYFINFYVHQLNLIRHLLGESYKVSYTDPAGVLMLAHSQSGIPATLEMSPYRTTMDWQESALVCFENGWLKLELPAPLAHNRPGRVEIFRDPGKATPETIVPVLPWVHAMRQQAINFITAIKKEAPPPCEAHEALEDLRIGRDYIRMFKGK